MGRWHVYYVASSHHLRAEWVHGPQPVWSHTLSTASTLPLPTVLKEGVSGKDWEKGGDLLSPLMRDLCPAQASHTRP
jgi:hypothetical protein